MNVTDEKFGDEIFGFIGDILPILLVEIEPGIDGSSSVIVPIEWQVTA